LRERVAFRTASQSAVHLDSPLLTESVLINPLTYYWQDGMSLEAAPAAKHSAFHYYLTAAFQPWKWLRLLTGRTRIGVGGAVRLLLERWRMRREARGMTGVAGARGPGHPPPGDLAADLDRVAAAGRRLTFVFSRPGPEHGILTFHAGRRVKKLLRDGKLGVCFIDGADHTFSRSGPRRALIEAVADHLVRRYGRGRG
jgi:hypothetical protein